MRTTAAAITATMMTAAEMATQVTVCETLVTGLGEGDAGETGVGVATDEVGPKAGTEGAQR